jgi:hypothetical protein
VGNGKKHVSERLGKSVSRSCSWGLLEGIGCLYLSYSTPILRLNHAEDQAFDWLIFSKINGK